jgi:hypothetical protein
MDHNLRKPVMVPQVDKHDPAVVADGIDPTGQPGPPPGIPLPQFPAGMRSVLIHFSSSQKRKDLKNNNVFEGRDRSRGATLH